MDKKYFILPSLLLIYFVIYTANPLTYRATDNYSPILLSSAIINDRTLHIDPYLSDYNQSRLWIFTNEVDGHYYSSYPIVISLLAVPFAVPAFFVQDHYRWVIDNNAILDRIAAASLAAMTAVILFIALRLFFDDSVAMVGTMLYAIGTEAWSINSQGLWSHTASCLILISMLCLVAINEKRPSTRSVILIAVLIPLYMFSRPVVGFLALPFLIYILLNNRASICLSMLASTPFVLYNNYVFGKPFGRYGNVEDLANASASQPINSMPYNFVTNMLSPSQGFITSPALLFGFLGMLKVKATESLRLRVFLYASAVVCIFYILLYGAAVWPGCDGPCYGPRYFVDVAPFMVLFAMLFVKDHMSVRDPYAIVFGVLLIASILFQFIGTAAYPMTDSAWSYDVFKQNGLWSIDNGQFIGSLKLLYHNIMVRLS